VTEPSTQKFRAFQLKQAQDGIDGGIRILAKPTRLVLFTMDRKILDEQSIESKNLWLTSENLRSSTERTVLISQDQDGEISTRPFKLSGGKLDAEVAENADTGVPEPMILLTGVHSAWKLSGAYPKEILQVTSVPGSNQIVYLRYWLGQSSWIKSANSEAGAWSAGQAFPAGDKFPSAGVLK
jgi:hypothetical protein